MRKIRDNSSGPPPDGLWKWRCPETNLLITHSNYVGLERAVKKYLRSNSFPIGTNWENDFEENVCRNMVPSVCIDFIPPTTLQKMTSLGRALYQAAKSWREPLVTAEELQDRRDWCAGSETRPRCNFYGGSTSPLRVACQRCGCGGLALMLKSKHCPLPEPKW